MQKKLFLLILLFTAAAGCVNETALPNAAPISPPVSYAASANQTNYSHLLQIGNKKLEVEVATSTAAMEQGLSDRRSMANNQGMLFDFGTLSQDTAFWMKEMDFGLDFVWINDNQIVGITPDVPPPLNSSTTLPLYYPPSPVNWVLEVNSGWDKANNITVGDQAELKN
jgi:uncharacterized membrane protein (UPF0127 family)